MSNTINKIKLKTKTNKMKKIIISISFILFIPTTLIISCSTPEQKLEKAEKNVDEANRKLDVANANYINDIEVYRVETGKRILENTKSIADFNARIASKKQDAREKYEREISALSQKNTDLQKRLQDYKEIGGEKWEIFKSEFNSEMYALGNSIRTFTINK
jgi:preprotein translocase subunit SecF